MIDWDRFAAKVPAGTMARSVWRFDVMLLENLPYSAMEENIKFRADWERARDDHQEIGEDRLKCQRINSESLRDAQLQTFIQPDCLAYYIDGAWVTFDQLMTED